MVTSTGPRPGHQDRLAALVQELTGCAPAGARQAVATARPSVDPLSVVAEAMITIRNGRVDEIDLRPERAEPATAGAPAFIGAGPDWP